MINLAIRFATAAVLATATAAAAASPAAAQGSCEAFIAGSGENETVEYRGTCPAQQGAVAVVVGSGENVSVRHVAPGIGGFGVPPGYTAVVTGSGDNKSVAYVPQVDASPRFVAQRPVPQG